jgi:type I restriction enzyme S subunit
MTFPCYPDYKDSGVEWLGDVPVGWGVSRVKFDSYVKARVGWHGLKSDEFTDEGPYLVTGSDFKNKTVDWSNCYHCTDERFEQDEYIQLKENDLLITKDGTIGKLILVENLPGKATLNSGIFVVRPLHEKYSTKFYFWLLQSSAFFDFVGINKTGSTIVHLYQETFENLPYALPPLVEQLQIALFLDHETARIDALIEEQQRLIELLKEKRQAVISHAVTKGLDPTVPMKNSGVEWLGEVPAHWDVGGLTRFIGPVVDYRGRTPTKVDEGVFLVTARNIRNGRIDYEASQEYVDPASAESLLARGRPEIGDLLFTMEAPLGQVALIDRTDIALAQRIVKFRGEPHVMKNHYLMYWFMSTVCQARLETLATGSTALGIKASKLGMIECLAPSLKEQDEIISYIQRETAKSDTLVFETEQVILLLQERRSALISAAVTGKIDVRDWQPPASTQAPKLEVAEAD